VPGGTDISTGYTNVIDDGYYSSELNNGQFLGLRQFARPSFTVNAELRRAITAQQFAAAQWLRGVNH
jgi:hypothetical protein